jgi:glutathione S-transferase
MPADQNDRPRLLLFGAPTSPFVRKARVVAIEHSLYDGVERVACDPFAEEAAFVAVNPIAQVPALVADGQRMTGSALISAYLDGLGTGPRLIPSGAARWETLAREAVADGVMECAVRLRSEGKRPEAERSADWTGRWLRGVARGLDRLEETLPGDEVFDLGVIAAVCAGTYIGFRHPHLDWSAGRPRLLARTEALAGRESFDRTRPDRPL